MTRPRTVLFLHGSSGGYGADRQLELLATGLDRARYRPLVVLPERGELGARLEAAGIELVLAPLAVLQRRLGRGRGLAGAARLRARNVRELGALARRRRVAIVHTNSSLILCGQRVAERASAAHVLHVREIYRNPLWPLLRRRLVRADAVACVSEAVAARFAGSPRAFVVYDGLPLRASQGDREAARRALGLAPDAFVVASIGRISDWKGQDVLVRALADPILADVGAVGLVAGDAAPRQQRFESELDALGASLALDGRLRLLGFRDDVDVLLAASDAVAVPSTYPDSLPNSALEAAAAGLPVVASDTGGQREIVRERVTGRIVPPGDAQALARALRELAEDPRGAARLGRAAALDARARFDPDRLVEEVQDRYDRLLATRATGPAAWLLPVKRLPVAHPVAPDLRIARQAAWLAELGYRPLVLRRGLLSAWRALRDRPALVLAAAAVHAPVLTLTKRLGARTVADVIGLHSLEVDQAAARGKLLRAAWTQVERWFVRSAGLVLAVNERHAQLVRERYGRSAVVLRDAAEAGLASIRPAERSSIGVPEEAVAIGFAGALVYGRLDPLLDVWPEVCAGATLVVAGDGPDLERIRGVDGVVCLGALQRDHALAVLAACDVGYSDCWSEAGFPAKVFEYLALGLPVVTAATPQAAEVLRDKDDALLYGTRAELADALRRLVDDAELRRRLGAAARRTALAAHTTAHRQREFEQLLDRSPVAIRPLAPADVRVLFPHGFGAEWLERQRARSAYVAVAELDGAPVGRVALDFARTTASGAAYLSSAYVRRRHRSDGVGTALCAHLESVARDRGYDAIELGVNKRNLAAQRFYGRLGYVVCGEEVVRWSHRRLGRTVEVVEDCASMRKRL